MKTEIHSYIMGVFTSHQFFESIEIFSENFALTDKELKKIQFYSDFFLPDGSYPFEDEDKFYYPVTLIYKANTWKTQWVFWKKNDIPEKNRGVSPFISEKIVEITTCYEVPQKFQDIIAGKSLFYARKTHHADSAMDAFDWKYKGQLNISFSDEVSRQISEQLIMLTGCNLSKWDITLLVEPGIVTLNDTHYICVEFKNQYADAMTGAICWKGDVKLTDYITNQDVAFSLTDFKITHHVNPIQKIIKFIKNNGFSGNKFDFKYPDVELLFEVKGDVTSTIKNTIFDYVLQYISDWNNNEKNEEKIHDFFWLNSDTNSLTLYIDFGDCSITVLNQLLLFLKKQNLNFIKNISVL